MSEKGSFFLFFILLSTSNSPTLKDKNASGNGEKIFDPDKDKGIKKRSVSKPIVVQL